MSITYFKLSLQRTVDEIGNESFRTNFLRALDARHETFAMITRNDEMASAAVTATGRDCNEPSKCEWRAKRMENPLNEENRKSSGMSYASVLIVFHGISCDRRSTAFARSSHCHSPHTVVAFLEVKYDWFKCNFDFATHFRFDTISIHLNAFGLSWTNSHFCFRIFSFNFRVNEWIMQYCVLSAYLYPVSDYFAIFPLAPRTLRVRAYRAAVASYHLENLEQQNWFSD